MRTAAILLLSAHGASPLRPLPLLRRAISRARTPSLAEQPPEVGVDTDGDGVADSIALDTVGDGFADTLVPLAAEDTWRRRAQELLTSPGFSVYSLILTIVLLVIFAAGLDTSLLGGLDALFAEEIAYALLIGEFGLRWWAGSNFKPGFLLTPIMVVDLLNILPLGLIIDPSLSVALPALSALRLLRATRILRLSRLFSKETFTKLVQALRGSSTAVEVSEVTRVVCRVAFTVAAVVLTAAGLIFEAERATNPAFSTFGDAIYFAITTLTTVGFGDLVPTTEIGRLIVAGEMLAAVTFIPYEVTQLFGALADARDGPRPARRRTTKARLEELQELRDAGLVSAKEYDAKRREVLDEL